jgi:hypothetical protein
MRRQEIIDGLKYIADSPAKKYGGFHPNAVSVAKAALKIIEAQAALPPTAPARNFRHCRNVKR